MPNQHIYGNIHLPLTNCIPPAMTQVLLLNKPYGVICQFREKPGQKTLADYIQQPGYYPAGRLDKDSEGLVILTNNGELQQRISHPKHKLSKVYLVQVEGQPTKEHLKSLSKGVELNDGRTKPAKITQIEPPDLWPRNPPIRHRNEITTSWLEITLNEGRNRQVRRMTAAIGHPTLRLVRVRIGHWSLDGLQPGQQRTKEVFLPNTKPLPYRKTRK